LTDESIPKHSKEINRPRHKQRRSKNISQRGVSLRPRHGTQVRLHVFIRFNGVQVVQSKSREAVATLSPCACHTRQGRQRTMTCTNSLSNHFLRNALSIVAPLLFISAALGSSSHQARMCPECWARWRMHHHRGQSGG